MHRWIPRSFAAAKQIRHQTGISRAPVSVSSAAIQLAKNICGDLAGKFVVLLGAGKMGELAALHLKESGASSIVVVNRTLSRAEALAEKFSGTAAAFKWRIKNITAADVVTCSTEAPAYLLSAADIKRVLARRPRRPILLLDISVPRNVDPKAGDLAGVHLFNIDDLEDVVKTNRRRRQSCLARAEAEIGRCLERFQQEEKNSRAAPAIAAIRNQVRSVCQAELKRFEQKVPGLNEEERDELKLMLHRIAQKILHPAIMELKELRPHNRKTSKQAFIEKLFGIDPSDES
jgi:glutamyl-tRNA reductase